MFKLVRGRGSILLVWSIIRGAENSPLLEDGGDCCLMMSFWPEKGLAAAGPRAARGVSGYWRAWGLLV